MSGFSSRPNNRNAAGLPNTRGSVSPHFPQLDAQMIKEFIGNFSSHIKYWKAMKCPCTTSQTGQPNIACNVCRGLGWAYNNSETDPIYQNAQVHSRTSKKLTEAGGTVIQGYSSMTFKPGVIPGEGDLVQVIKDLEVINDEQNVVGSVLTDGSTAECLRFRDVISIESIAMIDAQTKNISFLTSDKYSFDQKSRTVIFNPKFPAGTKYSLRYQAVPEYILLAQSARPLLRVAHDDNFNDPYSSGGKSGKDNVYPYNCQSIRLDRAIIQKQRGDIDFKNQSTFNSPGGKGPFR